MRLAESCIKKLGWGFGLCNMHCEHCYNSSSMVCEIPRYSFAELRLVADKVCPYVADINFGTGEFAVNPGTVELAEYIAEYYPSVNMAITSNGWSIIALQPSKIKRLFRDVDISIDFPSESKHNQFRKNPMAWQWAINALEVLQDIRIDHSIVCCITSKTNNSDIMGLLELATKFGSALRLNWFRKSGRGKAELQLTAKRAWEIIDFLSDKAVFQCLDPIFAGPLGVASEPCPAGRQSARIHQDMSVTAYPFLQGKLWSAGNILKDDITLADAYNSFVFQRLRERIVQDCAGCGFWKFCHSGCVSRAILHTGGINKKDDYCPIAADIDVGKIEIKFNKVADLIHQGYLCTTICWPQ